MTEYCCERKMRDTTDIMTTRLWRCYYISDLLVRIILLYIQSSYMITAVKHKSIHTHKMFFFHLKCTYASNAFKRLKTVIQPVFRLSSCTISKKSADWSSTLQANTNPAHASIPTGISPAPLQFKQKRPT